MSECIDEVFDAAATAWYLLEYSGTGFTGALRREAGEALAGKDLTRDELREFLTDVACGHHVDDYNLAADDFGPRAKESIRERGEKVGGAPQPCEELEQGPCAADKSEDIGL